MVRSNIESFDHINTHQQIASKNLRTGILLSSDGNVKLLTKPRLEFKNSFYLRHIACLKILSLCETSTTRFGFYSHFYPLALLSFIWREASILQFLKES